jgi:cyclophilin family peptidyl-prolyl cis-trans isomerase
MKSPLIVGCLALALSSQVVMSAFAQTAAEATPASKAAGSSQPAASSQAVAPSEEVAQAQAEFNRQFAQYKTALLGLEKVRTEYQTADEATRAKLNDEFRQQAAATQQTLNGVVTAAEKAYRLAPNSNPQITDLLVAVAKYYAVGQGMPDEPGEISGGDQYELALPVINLLVDSGAEEPRLPLWGLVSAFATNDYDLAEKYAEMAQISGVLSAKPPDDIAEEQVTVLARRFAEAIDRYRVKWAKESAIRAAEAKADDLPRVRLTTTQGDIVVELFENEAPQTVANFLTLVKKGFYDGVTFHRVIPKFMAQGGDPQGDGSGGPGYAIRCECYEPDARMHFRGSLSMAHSGRDTGGSQFFLTFVPTEHLDGIHTVFGRVIEGMDVLAQLQHRIPNADERKNRALPEPDEIIKAEVLRDRGHEYTFEKLPARG